MLCCVRCGIVLFVAFLKDGPSAMFAAGGCFVRKGVPLLSEGGADVASVYLHKFEIVFLSCEPLTSRLRHTKGLAFS